MIKSDSESRRVRMTKRMLKDALLDLMEVKSLTSVKVSDLCKLADVNRSTFYSYYDDITGLLKEIEDDVIDKIPDSDLSKKSIELDRHIIEDFTMFFKYVRDHSRDFSILLQVGDMHFSESLMQAVMERFPKPMKETNNPLLTRWGFMYATNGVIGLMQEWIKEDFPLSNQAFAELVLQMSVFANNAPLLRK